MSFNPSYDKKTGNVTLHVTDLVMLARALNHGHRGLNGIYPWYVQGPKQPSQRDCRETADASIVEARNRILYLLGQAGVPVDSYPEFREARSDMRNLG